VSNSSSSSFVVLGKKPTECESVLLSTAQANAVINYIETREWKPCEIDWSNLNEVYLTQFLSDCGDTLFDIPKKYRAYHYVDGNHGGPYSEENYDNLTESEYHYCDVWIRKEHNLEEE